MDLGGYGDLIFEQIADQHLRLPWACGKPHPGEQLQIRLQRTKEAKPLGVSTPAEYMSKIGRGEAKNAKAVAGSQLPVARKTLRSCVGSLRTGNWQLATAYDVGPGHQSGGHLGGGAGGNDDVVIVTRAQTAEHRRRLRRLDPAPATG